MERSLGRVPGVVSYQVDVSADQATVVYDPAIVTAGQIAQAVAAGGYRAAEVREGD